MPRRARSAGASTPRPYVIGESHAVTGPRAYIRTKDYLFSIKTRPSKERRTNMQWAMTADYAELEPVLYHTPTDPREIHNLAFSEEHRQIAQTLKKKLLDIVIGDGRVEVDWGQWGSGTEYETSNFAPRADDKQLSL